MAEKVFKFVGNDGNLKEITAAEIMEMSTPEFLQFKNRLVNVRERTHWDRVIWEKILITPQMEHVAFRKGYGQTEKYASSDNTYTKTRWNTSMPRNGEFEQGSLNIIYDIACPKYFAAGTPTTVAANGAVTNAKASAFSANNDPALKLAAWTDQVELLYREGDSEDGICRGLLRHFPANDGQTGFLGSSVGGVAQNVLQPNLPLRSPRVLEGGEDFSVLVRPLANFDTTNATGTDEVLVQTIELKVITLITLKA